MICSSPRVRICTAGLNGSGIRFKSVLLRTPLIPREFRLARYLVASVFYI